MKSSQFFLLGLPISETPSFIEFKVSAASFKPDWSAASFIALVNSLAMALAFPTNWPTFRNTTGNSFGPITIRATIATNIISAQPNPNIKSPPRFMGYR